jgi:hypothetical protein
MWRSLLAEKLPRGRLLGRVLPPEHMLFWGGFDITLVLLTEVYQRRLMRA